MLQTQLCAAWECKRKTATFDKPLCYEHWRLWESWALEECTRCRWFYGAEDIIANEWTDWPHRAATLLGDPEAFLCLNCTLRTLKEAGKLEELLQGQPTLLIDTANQRLTSNVPMPPLRKELKREPNYVYILKTNDGSFYVGQTSSLALRYQEHRDGKQVQTRGKDPKLVYFELFKGDRDSVNQREGELIRFSRTQAGQRQLRKLIEEFRAPLRLVDWNA